MEQKTTVGLLAVVALLQLLRIVGARRANSALSTKIGEVKPGESLADKLNEATSIFKVFRADVERWREEHVGEMRRRLENLERQFFDSPQGRGKDRGHH